MTGLRIDTQWQEADEVQIPELAVTWARMAFYVGDECLSVVEDKLASSYRKDIDVSAYPLAEWMAFNWWFLTTPNAGRAPFGASVRGYVRERQNLASAGDGFAWPPLVVSPEDNHFLLSQEPTASTVQRVDYVRSGVFVVENDETLYALEKFVDTVVRRLEDSGISDTRLQQEWATIQAADQDEVKFCRASAALGLDPYSVSDSETALLLNASADLRDDDLLIDLLPALNAEHVAEGVTWVADGLKVIDAASEHRIADGFEPLSQAVSGAADNVPLMEPARPWSTGYARARWIRSLLGAPTSNPVEIERLVDLAAVPREAPGRVEALVRLDANAAIAATSIHKSHQARRFVAARALSRSLFQQTLGTRVMSHGDSLGERVERAFAAEFLAPAHGLADFLGDDLSDNAIFTAAQHFEVNQAVIEHQVKNQLLGMSR